MKRFPGFTSLLTIIAVCFLAGCGRDSRLHGKWTFDREYTEAHLAKPPENPAKDESKDVLGAMKKQLAATLVPTLIEKLDGANLTITRKEMIITTKEGTGKAEAYEVVERPTADSWRVKTAEGKIETYSREGDRLMSPASGDVDLKVYFKPVAK